MALARLTKQCRECPYNTRSIVEEILEMIRTKLAEVENAEN